jgi:hypothetical protein
MNAPAFLPEWSSQNKQGLLDELSRIRSLLERHIAKDNGPGPAADSSQANTESPNVFDFLMEGLVCENQAFHAGKILVRRS